MPASVHSFRDNARAASFMICSMVAFTLNDACMKLLGDTLPLYQALTMRSVGAIVGLVIVARLLGVSLAVRDKRDQKLTAIRCLAEGGAAFFFLTALFNMPIANVTAILQVLPLAVSLAAALFLGEPLGWRRLLAIAVGFGGVALIVRPGGDGFTIYTLYALAAVACVTVRDLAARRLSPEVSSWAVAFYAACVVLVLSAFLGLTIEWKPMGAREGALLVGSVVFIIAAYVFSVQVMRRGDIAFVAPFRYSSLVAALILGFLIFGEWPDNLTLLGAGIVVATGLFAFYREAALAKTRPE